MDIDVPVGVYVVAVSGGVDSVVLLHLLNELLIKQQKTGNNRMRLIVAHFDHGIREDSLADRQLVQALAIVYGLPFVYDRAELGAGASEAVARQARYSFLLKVKESVGADAIITAHHEDDVLETIILNWLRGTKSRGLSSLRSSDTIRRPLLGINKKQIREYARVHNLEWREDSTNQDESYARNYIRKHMVSRLDTAARTKLLERSEKAAELNEAIRTLVGGYIADYTTPDAIDRLMYRQLPKEVAREILAEWIRNFTPVGITTKLILRIDDAIRRGRNGSRVDLAKGYAFSLMRDTVRLVRNEN